MLAAHTDGAACLGGDQLGGGLDVDAGAAAVGPDAGDGLPGAAVAAEHADGLGGFEFGLHIDPFVRLQCQGGAVAPRLDHAPQNQVLTGGEAQVLVSAHADDVAVDQQAIAAGVAGQIGQLVGVERAEVARLVEDPVLGLVAGCARVGAVVGHVVGLLTGSDAQVAAEGDQASHQHFLVGLQRHRAVAAGDGGGSLGQVVLGASLDVGAHVQRQHVGRAQVDRGVVARAQDAGQLMQDDGALRLHIERIALAPQNDAAALLQAALQVEVERVVVASDFDAAQRFERQAGGAVGGSGAAAEDEHPAVKHAGAQVAGHSQAAVDDRHGLDVQAPGQAATKAHAQSVVDGDGRALDTGQAGA